MSDDRNRLRKTIEAYGDAIGHSSRGTERSREEARCAASDMMDQALAMFDALHDELANAGNHKACAAKVELLERDMAELRARAEKAERERDENDARWCAEVGHANKWCAMARELEARLARYEAPGPALLYVECGDHDVVCESDVDTPCICAVGVAYREQHARCVAVISALKATHNEACIAYEAAAGRRRCRAHGCDGDVIEYGFELALAALTGEAGK